MDLRQLSNRDAAEKPHRYHLLHPDSLEPLGTDDEPAIVLVRGAASPTAQAAIAKARSKLHRGDDQNKTMQELHNELVDSAVPFIVGFENCTMDGKEIGKGDARAFLDLTFPIVGDSGELANKPFAQQVLEVAKDYDLFKPGSRGG